VPNLTRTFTIAELEELGAPYDLREDVEISRTHVDERRWSSVWELVFRHEGQVWSVLYERPATEHPAHPVSPPDQAAAPTTKEIPRTCPSPSPT
jgi:hypothetical protein